LLLTPDGGGGGAGPGNSPVRGRADFSGGLLPHTRPTRPLAVGRPEPPRPPGYTVTDLGVFGGTTSQALGINDAGQVVGWSDTPGGGQHAFLYDGGQLLDLGTFGGHNSKAYAINNAGLVVGAADLAGRYQHAFVSDGKGLLDL